MPGPRRTLLWLAAMGLAASVSVWIGLRVGRPAYYSDGAEAASAFELADAGMLRFDPPENGSLTVKYPIVFSNDGGQG